MNKKNKSNRRRIVYSTRSSSWPRLPEVETGAGRFDLPQMHLQLLRSRQNLGIRNDATGTDRESESNDSEVQLNTNMSDSSPSMRYSVLFESSNPFLPEGRFEEPCRSNVRGRSRGQPQRRSSSLASISQRSLWLADVLQEAIDISSTIGFSDDGDEDDDVNDSCNTDDL
jgi:hypothetical protein